jgi:hypothetical protein
MMATEDESVKRLREAMRLLSRLARGPFLLLPDEPPEASPPALRPAVELRGAHDKPLVFGVEKDELSSANRKAIADLLAVFPSGLKTSDLPSRGKNLRRLREDDPEWAKAIYQPSGAGRHGRTWRIEAFPNLPLSAI